jgi:MSHA biogenesis protein MshI
MQLFRKFRRTDGFRAVCFQGEEIRVAHVTRSGSSKPSVTMAMTTPLAGAEPASILSHFSKQWHNEQYECSMLVNSRDYQILPVEAPNVPPNELKSAVSFVVMDMLDFHIDQATIDVLTVPQDKNVAQRGRGMLAIAIRSELVGKYQGWFEAAKLPLHVIDIPEMAQRNIASFLESGERGIAMASFDVDGGLLTFTAGGELYQSRRIEATLDQLLNSEQSEREACYERIALEIQRSLDHFGRQFGGVAIAKLMVGPLGEARDELVASLAANLDIAVESLDLANVFDFARFPELKSPAQQQRYFMALGAALRVEEKTL